MQVTWLGHACFLLEQDGYRLILDPYTDVPGYPPLRADAHETYCSHGHFDHSFVQSVAVLPPADSPFTVEEIPAFHDDCGGALRGANTVRVFSAGGRRICHLGDLGHQLSPAQLDAVGRCDVLLVPVGGVYTLEAAGAKAVCGALRPRCAVPMHYRHAPCGLKAVSGVEAFLRLWPAESVRRLEGNSFSVTADLPPVLVPAYPA